MGWESIANFGLGGLPAEENSHPSGGRSCYQRSGSGMQIGSGVIEESMNDVGQKRVIEVDCVQFHSILFPVLKISATNGLSGVKSSVRKGWISILL
jgi:hypothetical protein